MESAGILYGTVYARINLAQFYHENGDDNRAKSHGLKALGTSKDLNIQDGIMQSSKILIEI